MTRSTYAVNVKRFKYSQFQPYEVFSGALTTSVYYLTIVKYSCENFCGTVKNHESLTQQNFPCLQYIIVVIIAIYAYVIVKDNVTDDEDVVIKDLKMAIKQHIGSFAVPHCFMVTISDNIRIIT